MTETIDFVGELHPLIADFRNMTHRHKSQLAPFFTPGGDVLEDRSRAYAEALSSQSIEAAKMLDTVMERLLELCGPPLPGRAHTLTFAGPERHDDEAPYVFVVNGRDLDDARRNLGALPFFREWYEEQRAWDDPDADPDVLYVSNPASSHPGIPDAGCYNDLRREQAALRETGDVTSILTANIPALEG